MATNQWLLVATYSYRIQITGVWIKIVDDKVGAGYCRVRVGFQGVLIASLAFEDLIKIVHLKCKNCLITNFKTEDQFSMVLLGNLISGC